MNVGVIGVGQQGRRHVEEYRTCRKAKVMAVADVNEELVRSVADKYGIDHYYTDYRDLLALDGIEAVSICTPVFNHAAVACDAAKAGKHVLCEKPMAMNASEADKMLRACNEVCVKLGICSSRSRLEPGVDLAKKYISEGKLGKIYYARSSFFRRRGRPFELNTASWIMDSSKAGGGTLIDIGCYDIDVILYLLGSPQPWAVSAMTFQGVGYIPKLETPYDVEEHATLFVRFLDGPVATFETAWASNMDKGEGISIYGTKGGLKLNPFTFYTEMDGNQVAIGVDLPRRWTGGTFIDDFVDACLENRKPKTPGEDGLKVMQVISMAYSSAKLNREVTLKEL